MEEMDIVGVVYRAKQLRAEETRKFGGILAHRMSFLLGRLGRGLASLPGLIGNSLRPLFSWNPQAHRHN